jgi:hypothetical protein
MLKIYVATTTETNLEVNPKIAKRNFLGFSFLVQV